MATDSLNLGALPAHVLLEISNRLPVKDRLNFHLSNYTIAETILLSKYGIEYNAVPEPPVETLGADLAAAGGIGAASSSMTSALSNRDQEIHDIVRE